MRVRRQLQAMLVGHFRHRAQFVGRHFRRPWNTTNRQHCARSNALQHRGTFCNQLFGLRAEFLRATRYAMTQTCQRRLRLGLREAGQQHVATTARNGQVGNGHLHAWPDQLAAVDLVAHFPVEPGDVGAHIAHRREAGFECGATVGTPNGEMLLRRQARVDGEVGGVLRDVGDVRVQVQQAGQAGLRGEIQRACAGGHSDGSADRHDLAGVDQYRLVQQHGRRQAINEAPTTHGQGTRGGTHYRRGHSDRFAHRARHTPWRRHTHQRDQQGNGLEARTSQCRNFHGHPLRLAALPGRSRVCGGNGAVAIRARLLCTRTWGRTRLRQCATMVNLPHGPQR